MKLMGFLELSDRYDYNPKAFENLVMDGVRKKIITSLINNYKNKARFLLKWILNPL